MVRIHREPPMEGPPGGAVAYTHFGARLARPGRCTLYQIFRPVVQPTRPTPNRCGLKLRTGVENKILEAGAVLVPPHRGKRISFPSLVDRLAKPPPVGVIEGTRFAGRVYDPVVRV